VTENSVSSFTCSWSGIVVKESEDELLPSSLEPRIYSYVYDVLKVLVLSLDSDEHIFTFGIFFTQNSQLRRLFGF
jgi:hypothetical protein